jgi:hypothetical protein
MGFGRRTKLILLISFICITLISIIGMGMITNAIFSTPKKSYCTTPTVTGTVASPTGTIPSCISGPTGNIFTITDSEIIISKIALGFYWSLCVISFIICVYVYGFTD